MNSKFRHIVIAAGLFPPDIGGPATYAAMIAKELPNRGIQVKVVPYGRVRHILKIWRHLVYTWILWKETKNATAVYALDPMSVGWPALIVSKARHIPLMVRLGGDYAWEQAVQRFGVTATLDEYTADPTAYGTMVQFFAWLQRQVVKRAVCTIVPSKYLKKILSTWPGIKIEKISVVPSALFPLPVSASRDELRKQFEYSGFVLITACRLVPWKGVETIVRVMSNLQSSIPDITLVVAGDGPERTKLETLASDLNLGSKVRFVGSLSKSALGASIASADLFVLNTAYEGLSHQILEVMDLGVPIITTNVGGNPELIRDGIEGRLVDFDDSQAWQKVIIELYNNPELRTRLKMNAQAATSPFRKDKAVDSIAKVINETIINS